MKKRLAFFLILAFIITVGLALSHEEEEEYDLGHSGLYPVGQLTAVIYGSSSLGLLFIAIFLFHRQMGELTKTVSYFLVAAIALLVTLYLVLTTLHLNFISETKGPVHWHADFEIWVCGKEILLAKPQEFLSNKQGTDLMHAHTDQRIHVEGVITDMKQASLGAFFYAVKGSISSDGIRIPADEGLIEVHDGDKCNEQPAKLYVFVNGNLIGNPKAYVISPYEKVPPGDRIKFVFTEKQLERINPNIGQKMATYESSGGVDALPLLTDNVSDNGKVKTVTSFEDRCDIDNDGACNDQDLNIILSALGECQGDSMYKSIADMNDDACINDADKDIFFQIMELRNK